jgi:hypothetical protein
MSLGINLNKLIINEEFVQNYNIQHGVPGIMRVYNSHDKSDIFNKATLQEIRSIGNRPVRCIIDPSKAKNLAWENTAEYEELWDKAKIKVNILRETYGNAENWKRALLNSPKQNMEHMPPGTTDLFDLMRIDITRRVMAIMDIVPFIAREIVNEEFDNPITAQWLYDYVAPFQDFTGTGDKVNMVYTGLGDKTPIYFNFAGVGFEQDLYNILFNKIFEMQKVNSAVAKFYVLRRNENVLSPILNFSYPTNKIVTYATGTNFSLDQMYYDTMVKAIKTLGMLLDFQTKQEIDVLSGVTLLCHSTRVWPWLRAISGQLLNGDQVKNLTALTSIVNRIIPYNAKRYKYFKKNVNFQGCGTDYSYLFISPAGDNQNWYLTKRRLTHKTGPGDTFSFSSDRDAWYTVDGVFNDHFLGGDTSDPANEEAAGNDTTICQTHGYVIAIQNPPDVGNESDET